MTTDIYIVIFTLQHINPTKHVQFDTLKLYSDTLQLSPEASSGSVLRDWAFNVTLKSTHLTENISTKYLIS